MRSEGKKTVGSVSGGKTSSYMEIHYPSDIAIFACVCIDFQKAEPKDPAILNYCLEKLNGDFIASAESEKTLKIMMQLEQKLGREIVWVRGKSFDHIIDNAGCLPTWNRRFCTTEMKIKPIFEYIYPRFGLVNENIGYRYDESHRAYGIEKRETISELLTLFGDVEKVKSYIKEKYRKIDSIMTDYPLSCNIFGDRRNNLSDVLWAKKQYPLIDDRIRRIDINKYWKGFPEFDFPIESNCAGCHHKNPATIKRQFKREPEIMEWFSLQEKKGKYNTWHDDVISYELKSKMNFTELLEMSGYGSCDSGGCTD